MHPLIRNAFALFFLCLSALNCFAGGRMISPVKSDFVNGQQFKVLDSLLKVRISIVSIEGEPGRTMKGSSSLGGRICSCQILNLGSSNYDHRFVVLLAERTNDGSSKGFNEAKSRIRKEKKHLKQMFYDKVKLVAEMQGVGSCKSMFYQLRSADKNLQLYEILNADIK